MTGMNARRTEEVGGAFSICLRTILLEGVARWDDGCKDNRADLMGSAAFERMVIFSVVNMSTV